jgi:hypothetical protein
MTAVMQRRMQSVFHVGAGGNVGAKKWNKTPPWITLFGWVLSS